MTREGEHHRKSFHALIGLGICNHVVLSGGRVTVALFALSEGASPLVVGSLMGLYAFLPMLLAVAAGRHSDRVGVRTPMLVGSCGIMLGAALPCVVPGIAPLYVATSLIGVSFMVFQVSMQNATGWYGSATDRASNFSLVALGYSISLFGGPLIAGLLIDHASFTVTFAVLALFPLVPIFFLARKSIALPGGHRAAAEAPKGGLLDLLGSPPLRRVYVINALLSMAWDLHSFFIPIYGASIGLSASRIGVILASFAAATFIVRLLMPRIVRHFSELEVLMVALFVAGSVFALFPFVEKLAALMALSFTLGLALGSGQPMVMSLLYSLAPAGRMGEAAGVRMTIINASTFAMPLLFGAVGSTLGLSPVFWTVGAALGGAGMLARRAAAGR
ncbi:MAG: MFS transporter [Betaproteobacteria bacterium]